MLLHVLEQEAASLCYALPTGGAMQIISFSGPAPYQANSVQGPDDGKLLTDSWRTAASALDGSILHRAKDFLPCIS